MEIGIQAGRDIMDQWVDVTVKGGSGQLISHVTTNLDGFPIGDDDLNPPESSYQRTWHQVGSGGANQTHQVAVTAHDQKGNEESASKTWQD
jgi:hypothetical protein